MVTYKANQQKLFTLFSKQDKNAAVYILAKFPYLLFCEAFSLLVYFCFVKNFVLMKYSECEWNEARKVGQPGVIFYIL